MLPAPFIMTSLTHNEMVNDCPETKEAVLLTVAKLKLLSEDVSKVLGLFLGCFDCFPSLD